MNNLVEYGGLIAAIWALSVFAIKPIRDSDKVDGPTKDAAAAALIGMSIISTAAAAFLLGANSLGTKGGGFIGVFVFLIPFFAMIAVYYRGLRQTPDNETQAAKTRRDSNRKATFWLGIIFLALAIALLVIPITGAFNSFEPMPISSIILPAK